MYYQQINSGHRRRSTMQGMHSSFDEDVYGYLTDDGELDFLPSKAASSKDGSKRTLKRYTMEDLEKPVVTAASALLDTEESALFDILSDIGEVKNKHLYPLFSFYLRQFQESIADYVRDPEGNQCEIDFWRGTMGYIYGESLCSLASLMFGLHLTVERLRSLAEKKMGLPSGALNPIETDPLRQEERASHVQQVFHEIVREHGNLADPEADSFFVIRRRKPRRSRNPSSESL